MTTLLQVSVCTNPDDNKEASYNQLAGVFCGISHTDKLLLIGDFNARIGKDKHGKNWQTWDREMQLQWRASTGSVL